jgi:hypothetical protein
LARNFARVVLPTPMLPSIAIYLFFIV